METMQIVENTEGLGVVRDWDGKLFEIASVHGDFVVLRPVEGGEPLVTRQAILDFFYKKEIANGEGG
jgi:hypothetical protein